MCFNASSLVQNFSYCILTCSDVLNKYMLSTVFHISFEMTTYFPRWHRQLWNNQQQEADRDTQWWSKSWIVNGDSGAAFFCLSPILIFDLDLFL